MNQYIQQTSRLTTSLYKLEQALVNDIRMQDLTPPLLLFLLKLFSWESVQIIYS